MKAVIYARYSSDSQREESIEGQLRECKEYAKRNDIIILGEYDQNISDVVAQYEMKGYVCKDGGE